MLTLLIHYLLPIFHTITKDNTSFYFLKALEIKKISNHRFNFGIRENLGKSISIDITSPVYIYIARHSLRNYIAM